MGTAKYMIFTNDELNTLAKDNLEAARGKLMDILCNYQGFKLCTVILVFDAYKVKGNLGETRGPQETLKSSDIFLGHKR